MALQGCFAECVLGGWFMRHLTAWLWDGDPLTLPPLARASMLNHSTDDIRPPWPTVLANDFCIIRGNQNDHKVVVVPTVANHRFRSS
ncbi:hypothetical protein PM082_003604 [Marasmius tenuissimus]|nr:hypothetical protein PM082_003604 [Marasmius tenuissimus]